MGEWGPWGEPGCWGHRDPGVRGSPGGMGMLGEGTGVLGDRGDYGGKGELGVVGTQRTVSGGEWGAGESARNWGLGPILESPGWRG